LYGIKIIFKEVIMKNYKDFKKELNESVKPFKLTKHQKTVIDMIWKLNGEVSGTTIVNAYKEMLEVDHINRSRPGNWMNDEEWKSHEQRIKMIAQYKDSGLLKKVDEAERKVFELADFAKSQQSNKRK